MNYYFINLTRFILSTRLLNRHNDDEGGNNYTEEVG